MAEKSTLIEQHREFWAGRGPSLILIPAGDNTLYDLTAYPQRFRDPQAMWENEYERARKLIDWQTDGIPTVRPNLGVVLVPAMAGQDFQLVEDSMPWPGTPLEKNAIRAARGLELADSETMQLALQFYQLYRNTPETGVAAYHADTQGVFDIAHLLRGDEIFYDLADPDESDWVRELMDISFELYQKATVRIKEALGENIGEMIHGHGTTQGIFFPHAGARIAEDTATLLSPAMIHDVILPSVQRCIDAFGGVFLHYCGHHEDLFRQLVALPGVKAVDLGNPEMYDLDTLMRWCAESNTVLYSRLPAKTNEDWRTYTKRIAAAVQAAGTRVVLRPLVFPESFEECAEMRALWHQETTP